MKKTNERGITLISLVITIIVLLILAGVAINLAVDSEGLFGKAGEAANNWNTSIAEEETAVQNILSVMEEITSKSTTIVVSEESDTPTLASAIEKLDEVTKEEVIISVETDSVEWDFGEWVGENGAGEERSSAPLIPSTNQTIKKLTIKGKSEDVIFTATGSGSGYIEVANGAELVFENITIKDETEVAEAKASAWEYNYLQFRGNLKFKNCNFISPVIIGDIGLDEEKVVYVECVECSFISEVSSKYAVWVTNGNVNFTDCEFGPGTRGLKVHEAYGTNVQKIVIDNGVFQDLSEKPGIALGTLNSDTEITIQNSTFKNCKAGKQGLYIYETDTDVSTFDFTQTGNEVINDT